MALGGIGSNKSGTATGTFSATTASVITTTRTWNLGFIFGGSLSGSTSTSVPAGKPSNIDLILRVQQSGSSPGRIYATPTESVARPVHSLVTENAVLRGVVKNLWKVYRYNQEYQAFLLGGSSEEEFLAIAERFADEFDEIPEGQLVFASSLLLNLLDESLTSSDVSVLVNADPYHIERALSSSSNVQRITS